MTKKNKLFVALAPFLALFGVAVLVAVLIRSAKSHKGNRVSFLKMVWYEIKFLFSFGKFVPSISVDED